MLAMGRQLTVWRVCVCVCMREKELLYTVARNISGGKFLLYLQSKLLCEYRGIDVTSDTHTHTRAMIYSHQCYPSIR